MMPIGNVGACLDLALRQGADFSTTLTLTTPPVAPSITPVPVDLTGCTLAAQIRRAPRAPVPPDAIFTITINSPPTLGTAVMTLSAATSALLTCGNTPEDPASRYFWDLALTDSNNLKTSLLYGKAILYREVTR